MVVRYGATNSFAILMKQMGNVKNITQVPKHVPKHICKKCCAHGSTSSYVIYLECLIETGYLGLMLGQFRPIY